MDEKELNFGKYSKEMTFDLGLGFNIHIFSEDRLGQMKGTLHLAGKLFKHHLSFRFRNHDIVNVLWRTGVYSDGEPTYDGGRTFLFLPGKIVEIASFKGDKYAQKSNFM